MQNSLEIKGYWWPNEREKEKLPGILTFNQSDGAILDLVGNFSQERIGGNENHDIILGISQEGVPLTLYKCSWKNSSFFSGGIGSTRYYSSLIFENVHFRANDDLLFHQLCGSYTDLDTWVNQNNFTIEREKVDGKLISKVIYVKPQKQLFDIEDGYKAGIGFSSEGPDRSTPQTEVKISQKTYLIVESVGSERNFHDLFEKLNVFTYLLQLAIQRVPYPLSLIGFSNKNVQNFNGTQNFPEIKIYYHPIEAFVPQKPLTTHEILFLYQDIDPVQINKWFNAFNTYESIIHIYRASFLSQRLFSETKFLNIAQSLETLHGLLYGNLNIPTEEYRERKDRVLEYLPTDLIEWVSRALQNANYKSFMLRIFELINNKAGMFTDCITDINDFAKRVRDTRNEYTHLKKMKGSFDKRSELTAATKVLTIVFEIYLFELIGFSNENVAKIANKQILKFLSVHNKF